MILLGVGLGELRTIPVLDLTIGAVVVYLTHLFWSGSGVQGTGEGVDERQLAATVILGQLSGIITASTVVLAGIGAMAALGATGLPAAARAHLFWAATWILLSLVAALWAMGTLPPQVNRVNVAKSHITALFTFGAFYLFIVACVRLGLGIWHALGASGG